jgi:hypothetical protein
MLSSSCRISSMLPNDANGLLSSTVRRAVGTQPTLHDPQVAKESDELLFVAEALQLVLEILEDLDMRVVGPHVLRPRHVET